jgi:hypothetical protein
MLVDPTTGNRTIISDQTHGTGPAFAFDGIDPQGVSRLPDGSLLVGANNGIFKVDPATGNRTILSTTPANGVLALGNLILALSTPTLAGPTNLDSINPVTGSPTVLTTIPSPAGVFSGSLTAIGDTVYVANLYFIESYSLSTGATFTYNGVSGASITPTAAATRLLLGGFVPPFTPTAPGINSFDPSQTTSPFGKQVVSDNSGSMTGPSWFSTYGLGVGANGQIFATNFRNATPGATGQVLSVDPLTGNRTILSDVMHGTGPTLVNPLGIYVVPEPSTIMLAVLGALVVLRRLKADTLRAAR